MSNENQYFVVQFNVGRSSQVVDQLGPFSSYIESAKAINAKIDNDVANGELNQDWADEVYADEEEGEVCSFISNVPAWEFGSDEISYVISKGRQVTFDDIN